MSLNYMKCWERKTIARSLTVSLRTLNQTSKLPSLLICGLPASTYRHSTQSTSTSPSSSTALSRRFPASTASIPARTRAWSWTTSALRKTWISPSRNTPTLRAMSLKASSSLSRLLKTSSMSWLRCSTTSIARITSTAHRKSSLLASIGLLSMYSSRKIWKLALWRQSNAWNKRSTYAVQVRLSLIKKRTICTSTVLCALFFSNSQRVMPLTFHKWMPVSVNFLKVQFNLMV